MQPQVASSWLSFYSSTATHGQPHIYNSGDGRLEATCQLACQIYVSTKASSPGSWIGRKLQRGRGEEKAAKWEPGLYCFAIYAFLCIVIVIMTNFLNYIVVIIISCMCKREMATSLAPAMCAPCCHEAVQPHYRFKRPVQLFSKAGARDWWRENKPVSRVLLEWLASAFLWSRLVLKSLMKC